MKVSDLRRKLMAALAAGGLLAPSAVSAANLNENLAVNPGFENVDTNTTGAYSGPLILNWGGNSGFAYSHNGSLSGNPPVAVNDFANGDPLATGGNWYFTPGNNGNETLATAISQTIDVSTGATATQIASGNATFSMGAFFNSYQTQLDRGVVHADFLNSSGGILDSASVSPAGNLQAWTQVTGTGVIPVGTQSVRVSLYGIADFGSSDGYTDNVDFRVTNAPPSTLVLSVNRTNGTLTLSNKTGSAVNISAYSVTSAAEALNPANWRSITDNYDAGNPGPNQVDAVHHWSELTDPTTNTDLSEADLQSGDGASLANSRTVSLGNANAWIRNPTDDLVFQFISNGAVVQGLVSYTGQARFEDGDFNLDNNITAADWSILRANQHANLSGDSALEAYFRGDLTGDFRNNHADFAAFKELYEEANGGGSFGAMLQGIPEPTSCVLVLMSGLCGMTTLRRRLR